MHRSFNLLLSIENIDKASRFMVRWSLDYIMFVVVLNTYITDEQKVSLC